jgi:hypothetical protein
MLLTMLAISADFPPQATGTINAAGMSFGVGGLAACALSAQEVTNCTVESVDLDGLK